VVFLVVQQLLKLGNPFLYGILVPLGTILFLALIPYWLPRSAPVEQGRWFPRGNRLAQILVALISAIIIILTLLALIPTVSNP